MRTGMMWAGALVASTCFAAAHAIAEEGESNRNRADDCASTSLNLTPEECIVYDKCLIRGASEPADPTGGSKSASIPQCDAAIREWRRRKAELAKAWWNELPVKAGSSLRKDQPFTEMEIALDRKYDSKHVVGKYWIAGQVKSIVLRPREARNMSEGWSAEITVDSVDDPVLKGCEKALDTGLPGIGDSGSDHQIVIKGRGQFTTFPPPDVTDLPPYEDYRNLYILEFKSLEKCELVPIEKPRLGMFAPAKSR